MGGALTQSTNIRLHKISPITAPHDFRKKKATDNVCKTECFLLQLQGTGSNIWYEIL